MDRRECTGTYITSLKIYYSVQNEKQTNRQSLLKIWLVYALTVFKCVGSSDSVVFRLSAKTKEQTLNPSEVDLIMNWRRCICLHLKMRVIQGKRRKWKHYQYLFGQTKNTIFLLKIITSPKALYLRKCLMSYNTNVHMLSILITTTLWHVSHNHTFFYPTLRKMYGKVNQNRFLLIISPILHVL